MKKWTEEELELLKKYEISRNNYSSLENNERDSKKNQEILLLEAKLLISNKTVICYLNNKYLGINSFNVALEKEEYYTNKGKLLTYYPIKEHINYQ